MPWRFGWPNSVFGGVYDGRAAGACALSGVNNEEETAIAAATAAIRRTG
jgi:hypothetical protein